MKIRKLFDELNNLKDNPDKAFPILKSFLYAEHYAKILCKKNGISLKQIHKCSKCFSSQSAGPMSLNKMIQTLVEKSVIEENLIEIFRTLVKLRNSLVHNLEPDNQDIEKLLTSYDPPTNQEVKNLFVEENLWDRFFICLIASIGNLHTKCFSDQKLVAIEKNSTTKQWYFHFQ